MRLVVGVISAMIEEELGERSFGLDSPKFMNCDTEEKGIVALDYQPPEPRCPLPTADTPPPCGTTGQGRWCLGSGAPAVDNRGPQSRATIPFSSMSRFSLLQIDVEVEGYLSHG